jgi:hypothetical protein
MSVRIVVYGVFVMLGLCWPPHEVVGNMPRRSHGAWALKLLLTEKDKMGAPAQWGALALHHKISKSNLDRIERDLGAALQSRDVDLAAAAKAFWTAAQQAAGRDVLKDAAGNMQKVLWNLTANVEIGPAAVAEDPGTRFDPNTEPIPGDGEGRRRLTGESADLRDLEQVYLTANRAHRPPTADEWNEMTRLLTEANKKHDAFAAGAILAPPRAEQWLKQVGDDAEGDQQVTWQRKRLRRFPGVAQGVQGFRAARALGEHLDNTVNGLMPNALVQPYQFQDFRRQQYTLVLDLQPVALRHMCRRHTYQHFDFNQAKLVNTFWPVAQVAGAVTNHATVTAALAQIARVAFETMELDGILGDWEGAKVTCVSVPINNATVFFIATVEAADDASPIGGDDGPPDRWAVHLKTVAPDGDTAQAFTAAELGQISQRI